MANHVYLRTSAGQLIGFEASTDGTIQQSPNGDDSTFDDMPAGTATSAATADAPADATTFTAALNVATTALPGLQSAADKIAMSGIDLGSWYGARAQEMLVAVPEITQFKTFNIAAYGPSATAPTFDGNIEGGAFCPLDSGVGIFLTRSLCQKMKTGKGVAAWRAKGLAPGAAEVSWTGFGNAGQTHVTALQRTGGVANWQLLVVGTTAVTGTIAADTAEHNFMLAWNGTNIRLFVDNVLAATLSDLTNVHDEPMSFYAYDQSTTRQFLSQMIYGYVAV